ncbi:hypothetical protein ACJ41O_009202 [Fusarium nematophilum]
MAHLKVIAGAVLLLFASLSASKPVAVAGSAVTSTAIGGFPYQGTKVLDDATTTPAVQVESVDDEACDESDEIATETVEGCFDGVEETETATPVEEVESTPATPLAAAKTGSSSGCGKTSSLASGTYSVTVNGQTRKYILDVPTNYNSNNGYKLVFGLHWRGGTMEDVATGQTVQAGVWNYYGLKRLASNSAVFVAPQGIGNGWGNSNGDDLKFIDAIIEKVEAGLCIDQKQRFATGFSYGGAMTYSLACSRASKFRAVAVLSGAQLSGCDGGNDPIPYLGIHGIGDNVLGISMGRSLRDKFVKNNGCTAKTPSEPASGSLTHTKTSYTCKSGYPVTWIAFDGGHIAAPQDGATNDSGSNTWAPKETWQFFSQFT